MQEPQSALQLSAVRPVPQCSVNWQVPSPQRYSSWGCTRVVTAGYVFPLYVHCVK